MTFEGVSALVKSSITLAFHALVWADALRKYLHAVNRNFLKAERPCGFCPWEPLVLIFIPLKVPIS